MKLYLDDDSASQLLAKLLRNAGHDVQIPSDAAVAGKDDAVHLTHAIQQDRVCLTRNHGDFENLHNLVMAARGSHPGVLVVRQDNDPTRDLSPRGIVRAIQNLLAAGVPVVDRFYVLNHWR
jgi:predicted nuclease of predicted toxin-antitoxin system